MSDREMKAAAPLLRTLRPSILPRVSSSRKQRSEPPLQESICKYTAGKNNEYIYIGRQKFLRDDLFEAFGGTLNPGLAPASISSQILLH
ncbi:CRE_HP_G0073250.mRNA.1.CDS.1 [Saccharomyces cerevisiae]|nr:CRE_HP_G0073250.mRNA.1.CDS.1 [Saccharomyces cerevisiae]CAI6899395.1 CRE_HP_G0073250.mRNA.1.CDS.1 [Saccharomyces cerevisiae]